MADQAIFQEGTEIVVDTETEAAAAGWGINKAHIVRTGALVCVHIEAANQAAAAALVTTLQADFAPGETILSADQNWNIQANGQVSFTGSTAAAATHVLDVCYIAGEVSP